MIAQDRYTLRSKLRWGAATSIIFGTTGWIVGSTIPGPVHGTSLLATVLWSLVMGTLGYIPGDLAGQTAADLRRYRV